MNKLITVQNNLNTALKEYQTQAIETDKLVAAWAGVQIHVTDNALSVQNKVHIEIANVVSRCLASVFQRPYVFEIQFERKRNKTEARLIFKLDGNEVDPLSAVGGGIVDVTAFALRVACMFLQRPPRRRLLVLDEPFRFVSVQYREAVAIMLKELTESLGLQLIIVTHMDELKLGKVITW